MSNNRNIPYRKKYFFLLFIVMQFLLMIGPVNVALANGRVWGVNSNDDIYTRDGVNGSAVSSVLQASGLIYPKVPSAPGNHAKVMIIDDELYVVGSDNLYPGNLSEINYLIEGEAVQELILSYWNPLWSNSGPHAIKP